MLILNCRMERRNKTKQNKSTSAPTSGRIIWIKWGSTSGFSGVQRSWPGGAVSRQVSLLSQDWHMCPGWRAVWQVTHTCQGCDDTELGRVQLSSKWIEHRSLEMTAGAKMALVASFSSCHPTCNNSLQENTLWSTVVRVKRAICTKTSSHSVAPVLFRHWPRLPDTKDWTAPVYFIWAKSFEITSECITK